MSDIQLRVPDLAGRRLTKPHSSTVRASSRLARALGMTTSVATRMASELAKGTTTGRRRGSAGRKEEGVAWWARL